MRAKQKSTLRNTVSRGFASLGFGFYNMSFGQADIEGFAVPNRPDIEAEIRVTEEIDEDVLSAAIGLPAAPWIEQNLRMESRCVTCSYQGVQIAFMWLNQKDFIFLGHPVHSLPQGHLCMHNVWISQPFRGRRVLQLMLLETHRQISGKGLHTMNCVVDQADQAAIATFSRLGVQFHKAPMIKLPGLNPVFLGHNPLRGKSGRWRAARGT